MSKWTREPPEGWRLLRTRGEIQLWDTPSGPFVSWPGEKTRLGTYLPDMKTAKAFFRDFCAGDLEWKPVAPPEE